MTYHVVVSINELSLCICLHSCQWIMNVYLKALGNSKYTLFTDYAVSQNAKMSSRIACHNDQLFNYRISFL